MIIGEGALVGIGATVMIPDRKLPKNVRSIQLAGFSKIPLGAFWRGKLNPIQQALLKEVEERAISLAGGNGKQ